MTKRERWLHKLEVAQGYAPRLMALGEEIVRTSCELKTVRFGHDVYKEASWLGDLLDHLEKEMQ